MPRENLPLCLWLLSLPPPLFPFLLLIWHSTPMWRLQAGQSACSVLSYHLLGRSTPSPPLCHHSSPLNCPPCPHLTLVSTSWMCQPIGAIGSRLIGSRRRRLYWCYFPCFVVPEHCLCAVFGGRTMHQKVFPYLDEFLLCHVDNSCTGAKISLSLICSFAGMQCVLFPSKI